MTVRLAVIGAGVMGSNHARVARQLDGVELVAVVDPDLDRATAAARGSAAVSTIDEVLDRIDAAVIAVPTPFHHELALRLIAAGRHLLVEKPLAMDVDQGRAIVEAARAAGTVLAVGHIERFNAAVAELPLLVERPVHVRAERINPYSPRISDGVILDLMIHDLDIVLALAGPSAAVSSVSGVAVHARGSGTEDLAAATITFDNGMSASLTTSRLGQQKVRRIEVTELESVVIADLLRQDVTVHRMTHAEYLSEEGTRYRQTGMVEIPFLETRGEPLALELRHFAECVRDGGTPRVDGAAGLRALDLAHRVSDAVVRTDLTRSGS